MMEELQLYDLLDESLIFFDYEVEDRKQLLIELSGILFERGYVKESYTDAILKREAEYPTGLATQIMKIAVPHASIEHVNKPCILIATLKEPVCFKDMGNGVDDIPVDCVFMLSVNKPKNQLLVLQQIIGLFSDNIALSQIKDVRNAKALINVIKTNIFRIYGDTAKI